jgi:hypothetical protein
MTAKVVVLQVKPGIQRDGTQLAAPSYVDGKWVRFQNGLPRKVGGYRGVFLDASGVSRGMIMSSENGLNYVVSGYNNGVEQWTTDDDDGVGAGPVPFTIAQAILSLVITNEGLLYTNGTYTNVALQGGSGTGALVDVVVSLGVVSSVTVVNGGTGYQTGDSVTVFAADIGGTGSGFAAEITALANWLPSDQNLWQFDIGYDSSGGAVTNLIAHPGLNLEHIDNTTNTRPLVGPFTGTVLNPVGVFTASGTTTNGSPNVTFAATNVAMGAGVAVSGTGIPSGTTIVSASEVGGIWTVVLSQNATASGTVTLTFDNNISVSGGVVMLFPYLFVYGNNGLIKNCAAGNFNDWSSADANENNVASTKVVKGLPLRGGTTSPAGLFWTLDSVVRVTYQPSTVNGINYYWKYDLLTQQSSIMSSQCVIEYDGIFYWAGTDRFLMYNGTVQEVPNNQNQNFFFDNLNYAQRQKVWVTKVPRFGEIWWFYPHGDSTECNNAIIYNTREKVWYDAGFAPGAARSAGTFTEVFRKPIWGGNVSNNAGGYTLWQHESGTDEIYTNNVNAIDSYFETPTIGQSVGLVATTQQPGDNVWTRCERVEPDFVQSEQMYVQVYGKGYADDVDQVSSEYPFDPDTLKVDMREQRREMRLRFGSNTVRGNYFMGKVILSVDMGDVRGTANP